MLDKNDWRLTNQMNYLSDKKLFHTTYKSNSENWDHDHCDFCMENIDATTGYAYCTTDNYHWICEDCFNDFHEMFKWKVIAEQD